MFVLYVCTYDAEYYRGSARSIAVDVACPHSGSWWPFMAGRVRKVVRTEDATHA